METVDTPTVGAQGNILTGGSNTGVLREEEGGRGQGRNIKYACSLRTVKWNHIHNVRTCIRMYVRPYVYSYVHLYKPIRLGFRTGLGFKAILFDLACTSR